MSGEAANSPRDPVPATSPSRKTELGQQRDFDPLFVALAAAAVSLVAFLIYYRAGDVLLYGDAVAHINIARRVFDSRTPGLLQLGTVWLPLPHLLILPFVVSHSLWQTGIGGSIPSMLAYVLSTVGIFRLGRALLLSIKAPPTIARFAAFASAAIFALNPNLLYLQSTAMTEPIYLAWFIWAAVYLQEFLSANHGHLIATTGQSWRLLLKCALCSAGASLTRYDGWFLAATLAAIVAVLYLREPKQDPTLRPLVIRFILILAAAPALWLSYNTAVYRNPIEFANGPYSARAIEHRSQAETPTHPGTRNLSLAAFYFLKCATINVAEGRLGWLWFVVALAASVRLAFRQRLATSALLWSPVAFYALSIAYGSVPIYMPDWYPHSAYNVRYGLELLPAFAVLIPVAAFLFLQHFRNASVQRIAAITVAILVAASYGSVWHAHSVTYREAFINSRTRLALEAKLASEVATLPPDSSFLMYLGNHVGALQQAGIPLRRSVNEGNHRVWMQPSDPDGLWERSLADPAAHVDYVVAIEGDLVASAMRHQSLPEIMRITAEGQPPATIYRAR